MDHHYDFEIEFAEEDKHKTLYSWYLFEKRSTNSAPEKLVPWDWSFYFMGASISRVRGVETEWQFKSKTNKSRRVNFRDRIAVKLKSSEQRIGSSFERTVKFSMLGTNRELSEIELTIAPIEPTQDTIGECCSAWGCVSYTAENDFRNFTTNDNLLFTIFLTE